MELQKKLNLGAITFLGRCGVIACMCWGMCNQCAHSLLLSWGDILGTVWATMKFCAGTLTACV